MVALMLPTWKDEDAQSGKCSKGRNTCSRTRNFVIRRRAIAICGVLVTAVLWGLWAVLERRAVIDHLQEKLLTSTVQIDLSDVLRSPARNIDVQEPLNFASQTLNTQKLATKENQKTASVISDLSTTASKTTSTESTTTATSLLSTPTTSPVGEENLGPNERAQLLSDVIHIPFEDATLDETLEGWEDEWFSDVKYDQTKWGKLKEPTIDFIYLWVNGSDNGFAQSKQDFEIKSSLNDADGYWISHHSVNRYRDWDELRYSIRSLEKYTGSWKNTIQVLVNSIRDGDKKFRRQMPTWLNTDATSKEEIKLVSQEELFDEDKQSCLPSFNSLTIENQIFNTKSSTDHFFALSDDMLLGKPHAASDFYSPLYGPTFGFKANTYNIRKAPTETDLARFGEKPYLIYTSWLLNRRFGERKRKGQAHFGHSLSRSVMKEALSSFPRPELESACQRFRGEGKSQIYSWYVAFHYTMERHREALLWSYLMHRADRDEDGRLDWPEREQIMRELEAGVANEGGIPYRQRNFYHLASHLETAGLEPPRVNEEILWTSLDGPAAIHELRCAEFDVDECLAPGFGSPDAGRSAQSGSARTRNPSFSTAAIFERVSRTKPECGDCLLKLLLNQQRKGLGSLLPDPVLQPEARTIVLKALKRYQYTIIEPDALFYMVTDAEQVENGLLRRFAHPERRVGQLCLNDDVVSEAPEDIDDVKNVMTKLYKSLLPEKSKYEL